VEAVVEELPLTEMDQTEVILFFLQLLQQVVVVVG
jgi:hypothetical protein